MPDTPSLPATDIKQTIELDPKRLQNFVDLLSQLETRRVWIPIEEIWDIFNTAFPHRPRSAEVRKWLLIALQSATGSNIIKLPAASGKRWDRLIQPPIPTSVARITKSPQSSNDEWRKFPWHPRLAWVHDLTRLTPDQEKFLQRVNRGLAQGAFDKPAPFTRRSLELTDSEKGLQALTKTKLFAPGRLSLELLGCVSRIPPLVKESVRDRPIAIVFENAEPFKIAYEILKTMPNPPYGIVAFGGGKSFRQAIRNFESMDRSIECIEYVGDLDRAGLSIAQSAAKIALDLGLPPVIAARGIHRAMLQEAQNLGHVSGLTNKTKDSDKHDEDLVAWLPTDVRQQTLDILRARRRVPEEFLSSEAMLELWEQLALK